jgi:hypothetical protein
MARGSRDIAKFSKNENGKRFKGLSQIFSKRKWQEVQGDLPKSSNENGKRFKGT